MTTTNSFPDIGRRSESGMSLLAVMAIMTLFAIALLAVAPSVQVEVQREKELETIRRGEEVADAIRQYVEFYRGAKLPNSIDDLLEGLPEGTKTRQILRESAAVDPLSPDGKWALVKVDPQVLARFARRVQNFNNGLLPSNPPSPGLGQNNSYFDRYSIVLVNSLNDVTDTESQEPEEESDLPTDNTPFIGVVSQSRSRSVLTYYGAENHSKWIFTPMFRGTGASRLVPQPTPIRDPVQIID
jgi:type II secretory pathway pseudopilin PulG